MGTKLPSKELTEHQRKWLDKIINDTTFIKWLIEHDKNHQGGWFFSNKGIDGEISVQLIEQSIITNTYHLSNSDIFNIVCNLYQTYLVIQKGGW